MRGLTSVDTSTTPSTSGGDESIVHDVSQLPEAVVEVMDLEGDYGGDWLRVREAVNRINRTNEDWMVATARVHVFVSDRSVRKIGANAFRAFKNLVKVTAPFVEEVGVSAFNGVCNLRHLTFSPDVVVKPNAFFGCLSLEVIAASVGLELDTGDKYGTWNDPSVGITRFLWRQNQEDASNKEYYESAMVMLELCDRGASPGIMRASTNDPLWAFLAGPGRDLAKLVLCFKLGVKDGKGDLREASKAKLLEVGLELKVLRMEHNFANIGWWGVVVDGEGTVIEGGIREAVSRGLVVWENYHHYHHGWGLSKWVNGDDVYVWSSRYGEKGVVYGRMVNGMVVPVEEGLFVE